MNNFQGKIVAIIQARMGSTRLPGKVLSDIEGRPMLVHVVERLRHSKFIDEIVVATTCLAKDNEIEKLCIDKGLAFFRGSEKDVLDRYYKCALEHKADVIVRITSDCPLIDPEVVDKVVAGYISEAPRVHGASNVVDRTYPRGLGVEVISFSTLECLQNQVKNQSCREHVTLYIYKHPEKFEIVRIKRDVNLSGFRWTVDEEDDLRFVREVYKRLYREDKIFLMDEVVVLIEKEPRLKKINGYVRQKAVS